MDGQALDPRVIMRQRRMNLQQYGVVALCVCINLIDGYDILALSLAASALKAEWMLSDALLGTLLAANLLGMALGALGVSPVADQWGRRPAILSCLLFMSAGMAISANSQGFEIMALGRLITGIGIGGMTSTAGTLALEYASEKRREFAASAVAVAFPIGTIVGSYVALMVLDGFGWRGIFWVGAGLSAVLFPIAFAWLPESLDYLLNRQPKGALDKTNKVLRRMDVPQINQLPPLPEGAQAGSNVINDILKRQHIRELLKLFPAHALNMFAWYFIISWGPPLVSEIAGTSDAGPRYAEWVSYGGIIGGMTAGYLCGIIGVKRIVWFTMLGLAALIALFGHFLGDRGLLMIIAPLMGAALFGSATANWLTIAYAFPPQVRATGLGLVTLAGRIGSMFGPAVGGILLNSRETGMIDFGLTAFSATLTIGSVCMIMAVPAILSAMIFSQARRVEPGK